MRMKLFGAVLVLVGWAFLFGGPIAAQSRLQECDPSLGLAHMQHTPPKGRLQDAGAPQTEHILKLGKKAIPMLIACLTDETRTKEPIEDYWPVTTVGDIAFFYLCDLFTDSTWRNSTIDRVPDWKSVEAEYPDEAASGAWYEFVKRHGRKYVQGAWWRRWKEVQASVVWDDKEQRFKVAAKASKSRLELQNEDRSG